MFFWDCGRIVLSYRGKLCLVAGYLRSVVGSFCCFEVLLQLLCCITAKRKRGWYILFNQNKKTWPGWLQVLFLLFISCDGKWISWNHNPGRARAIRECFRKIPEMIKPFYLVFIFRCDNVSHWSKVSWDIQEVPGGKLEKSHDCLLPNSNTNAPLSQNKHLELLISNSEKVLKVFQTPNKSIKLQTSISNSKQVSWTSNKYIKLKTSMSNSKQVYQPPNKYLEHQTNISDSIRSILSRLARHETAFCGKRFNIETKIPTGEIP